MSKSTGSDRARSAVHPRSSDDIIHLSSPHSSDDRSLSDSFTSTEDWIHPAEDDLGPSESASQLRRKSSSRHSTTRRSSASRVGSHVADRPEAPRRKSSIPVSIIEEVRSSSHRPHHHSHSRHSSTARSERDGHHKERRDRDRDRDREHDRDRERRPHKHRHRHPSDESQSSASLDYYEERPAGYARHPDAHRRPLPPHSPSQWLSLIHI